MFEVGDIVRILTIEEYNLQGHDAPKKCILDSYSNSICEIIEKYDNDDAYKLAVIILKDKGYSSAKIQKFWWAGRYLEYYSQTEINIGEDEIDSLLGV